MALMLLVPGNGSHPLLLRRVTATEVPEVLGAEPRIVTPQVLSDFPWHALVGRHGAGPPPLMNARARRLGTVVGLPSGVIMRGNVLICGRDSSGRPQNVPDDVVRVARVLGMRVDGAFR